MRSVMTFAAAVLLAPVAHADPATYATPQDALDALAAALTAGDRDAVLTVFGPENEDIISTGDAGEDAANREAVLALYNEGYRFVPEADGAVSLALGEEGWPFPIPLLRGADGWSFDAVTGEANIIAREIGLNELDVIDLMDAYVDVQAAFRLADQDGDGVMEFARHIIAEEGTRNGLFWPEDDGPLGELIARASATGFSDGSADHAPEPHLGYLFRILDAQGPEAPGGEMSYLVNGHMLGGHALLAVPAAYGESGVHSFLVAENGIILEADLGDDSLAVAAEITAFNPDERWSPVD